MCSPNNCQFTPDTNQQWQHLVSFQLCFGLHQLLRKGFRFSRLMLRYVHQIVANFCSIPSSVYICDNPVFITMLLALMLAIHS